MYQTIFHRIVDFDVTGTFHVTFTSDTPSTTVCIQTGEIKTNFSEKNIVSIVNQLSMCASLFSIAAHLLSPRSTGTVTAKVFLQKIREEFREYDGADEVIFDFPQLLEESGLTTRKLAPGFKVAFEQEEVC